MNGEDHGLYYKDESDLSSSVLTNLCSPFSWNRSPPEGGSKDDQIRLLDQYADHQYTAPLARAVVDGFIRDATESVQSEDSEGDSLFIPDELYSVMFRFYHQESSVYFHFGYRLHQKLGDGLNGRIAGDSLFITIEDNVSVLHQDEQPNHSLDASTVCCNLLKHGFIELAAFRASFFTLFDEPEPTPFAEDDGPKFLANDQNFYTFSPRMMEQFVCHDANSNTKNSNRKVLA